jgi:hypothetical protein
MRYLIYRNVICVRSLKLSLVLIKHCVMKTYGVVEVYLHSFLTSALDGSECQLYALAAFSQVKGPLVPIR